MRPTTRSQLLRCHTPPWTACHVYLHPVPVATPLQACAWPLCHGIPNKHWTQEYRLLTTATPHQPTSWPLWECNPPTPPDAHYRGRGKVRAACLCRVLLYGAVLPTLLSFVLIVLSGKFYARLHISRGKRQKKGPKQQKKPRQAIVTTVPLRYGRVLT